MKEGQDTALNPEVKRCSNCDRSIQLVSRTFGGSVDDEGMEERWYIIEPKPIGQSRRCYSFLKKLFLEPVTFIYPDEDDTCINLRKFKSKNQK